MQPRVRNVVGGPVDIAVAAPSTRRGGRLSLILLRFGGHGDE